MNFDTNSDKPLSTVERGECVPFVEAVDSGRPARALTGSNFSGRISKCGGAFTNVVVINSVSTIKVWQIVVHGVLRVEFLWEIPLRHIE